MPAPRLTLKSSSCSIATVPVSRTRTVGLGAFKRAAISRIPTIARAAGCRRAKSSAGCSTMMRRAARARGGCAERARPKRTSAASRVPRPRRRAQAPHKKERARRSPASASSARAATSRTAAPSNPRSSRPSSGCAAASRSVSSASSTAADTASRCARKTRPRRPRRRRSVQVGLAAQLREQFGRERVGARGRRRIDHDQQIAVAHRKRSRNSMKCWRHGSSAEIMFVVSVFTPRFLAAYQAAPARPQREPDGRRAAGAQTTALPRRRAPRRSVAHEDIASSSPAAPRRREQSRRPQRAQRGGRARGARRGSAPRASAARATAAASNAAARAAAKRRSPRSSIQRSAPGGNRRARVDDDAHRHERHACTRRDACDRRRIPCPQRLRR